MSNRQARREQSRQSANRAARPARPTQRRGTSSSGSGGGGSDIFSRGFLLAIAGLIIVLAIVLSLYLAFFDTNESEDLITDLEAARQNLPLDMANGTKLGLDTAPVKITAFEDFQCPFCLQYTAEQEPDIVEQLIKTGEVQIEFRHLPILGSDSLNAAQGSECAAEQNKFWEYHHLLFLTQAKADQIGNERTNIGRFSDDNLKGFATDVGLDRTQFDACYDSQKYLEKVTNDQREANEVGITGTPGFLVNGARLGTGTPVDIDAWKQVVENVKGAIATATANATLTPAAATAAPTATPTP